MKGESGCTFNAVARKGLGDPGGDAVLPALLLFTGEPKRSGNDRNSDEGLGLAGCDVVAFFTGENGLGRADGGSGSRSFSVGLECTMIGLDGCRPLLVDDCCCCVELLDSVLNRLYLSARVNGLDHNYRRKKGILPT